MKDEMRVYEIMGCLPQERVSTSMSVEIQIDVHFVKRTIFLLEYARCSIAIYLMCRRSLQASSNIDVDKKTDSASGRESRKGRSISIATQDTQ